MIKAFLPLIISLCFILESVFVELLPEKFFASTRILVPHFLIVAIIFTTIYGNKKSGLMYGFIFGLLFDIVYTEIIGIYLFLIPLVVYVTTWIMKVLQSHIVIVCLVALAGVTLLEFGVYGMNLIIGHTTMALTIFVDSRLFPTLVLNFIFILIVAYPLKKYLDRFTEALRND
ncbi:rod shape-determining protein MreD [Bacillus sp. V3B]|uniref:rod shape-determining protein MreD n=1 Tax=Bacillus sp. V3B TaxID=2804915 RepID=UPI00210BFD3E|nr:rod shape-determining protein MreD [Bacillus sp. V3B]MCQ6273527.1 rod shape-determining protein MreD [Bacillus sp. V3B]